MAVAIETLVEPSRRGRRPEAEPALNAVLLAEDQRAAHSVAELFVAATGKRSRLEWTTRASEASARAGRPDCEVVLAVFDRPDGGAIVTLQQLAEGCPETPVVVLTEFPPDAFAAQALAAGAQDCLARGDLTAPALGRALHHAVERHRLHARDQRELWSAGILHADFLSMVRNSTDAILVLGAERTIEYMNPSAELMFGLDAGHASGRPSPFALGDGPSFEIDLPEPGGAPRHAEVRLVETSWRGQHATLALARDISERRLLESQLAQAQKLESVGRLAAGIAHEINTPTQFITGNVKFLRGAFDALALLVDAYRPLLAAAREGEVDADLIGAAELAEHKARLELMQDEVPEALADSLQGLEEVARIVGAMRVFAHPGSSERAPVDLARVIDSAVALARNEWKDVATVTVEVAPELPFVPGVSGDLSQVLLNLVVNAAHAISEAGRDAGAIRIEAREVPGAVELTVGDNGTGIAPGIGERVFDPFFTTKDVGHGSGQGLAISRSIVVDRHGGAIDFDSTPEGTTFRVRLPLIDAAAEPARLEGAA